MNALDFSSLVDEGHTLKARMEADGERLKAINKTLQDHAAEHPEEHQRLKDEEREGTRFLIQGSAGREASVIFTSDLICQSFARDSREHARIEEAADGMLSAFFKETVTFQSIYAKSNRFDGKAFRQAARYSLTDPERFIDACCRRNKDGQKVSQTKVEWS